MQPERDLWALSLNFAVVVKGPVAELEDLFEVIREFVEAREAMRLVFRELSGDKLMIVRKGDGP